MFAYHDSREREPESVWEREEGITEDGHRTCDTISALELLSVVEDRKIAQPVC